MPEEGNYVIKHTSRVIYATLPGGSKAYLKYEVEGNVMKLVETYVPPEFRGKGIASRLVDYAVNLAFSNGWLIEPICSYAIYYFMKNEDKRDILVEDFRKLSNEAWQRLFESARMREESKKQGA